jgi:hypothetical protein
MEVKVVNPADVPAAQGGWQKTDRIDSRNLCKHLSDGNSKESMYLAKSRNN